MQTEFGFCAYRGYLLGNRKTKGVLVEIWVASSMLDFCSEHLLNSGAGASVVAQWLRICLSVQGTRVQALVREDPTCHGATKPASHNY